MPTKIKYRPWVNLAHVWHYIFITKIQLHIWAIYPSKKIWKKIQIFFFWIFSSIFAKQKESRFLFRFFCPEKNIQKKIQKNPKKINLYHLLPLVSQESAAQTNMFADRSHMINSKQFKSVYLREIKLDLALLKNRNSLIMTTWTNVSAHGMKLTPSHATFFFACVLPNFGWTELSVLLC